MKEVVGIVDYGVGNLHSIYNSIVNLGFECKIIKNDKTYSYFSKLILPGVGAFPYSMEKLRSEGNFEKILNFIKSGKNLLGVCLGMQILSSESFELKRTSGIGFFDAKVKNITDLVKDKNNLKIPNIGWEEIIINFESKLFKDFTSNNNFLYFAHSFALNNNSKISKLVSSNYLYNGTKIISSIEKDNVYGVQFHPEKSGQTGIKVLKNFLNLSD